MGGADTNGGTYSDVFPDGPIGFAGWAPQDAIVFRQALIWNSVTMHHYPGYPSDVGIGRSGQIWDKEHDTSGGDNPGDSGGPVFVQRPDLTRDVIGILSGDRYTSVDDCGFGSCTVWADITRGLPADFVRVVMVDTSRSPAWLLKHGKADQWLGEVDYTGPCKSGPTPETNDTDCDHWFDVHDYCPLFFNPAQVEGDPCGRCPLLNAANADPDNDGVCDPADNCPNVWNDTQSNCNLATEQAQISQGLPTKILGDACDPVPCPFSDADQYRQTGPANGKPACTPYNNIVGSTCTGRSIHDDIHAIPIGAGPVGQVSNSAATTISVPVLQVPTDARFCQSNLAAGFDCHRPAVMGDDQVRFDVPMNSSRPWHTVTLVGVGASVAPTLDYDGVTSRDFTWDYASDNASWTSNRIIPPPGNYSTCADTASFGPGTCLDGTFWLHGETLVGTASLSTVGSTLVGVHPSNATQLANHYFDIRPDAAGSWRIAPFGVSPLQAHVAIWATLPDPGPDGSQRLIWAEDNSLPVALQSGSGQVLGLQPGNVAVDLSSFVSVGVTQALANPNVVTVNAAEPSRFIGGAANLPETVLLASDATHIVDTVQFSAGRLALGSEVAVAGRTVGFDPPSPRSGALAVFSRSADALFVVGGTDPTTDQPLHDVWVHPLDTGWTPVNVAGPQLGEVKAATYSFLDRQLWLIDREASSRGHHDLRLVSVDPLSGKVAVVTRLEDFERYDSLWTVVDTDGGILVVGSSSKTATYRVAKLRIGQDDSSVTCLTRGTGTLAMAPIVDTHGYSFVIQQEGGTVRLLRQRKLDHACEPCDPEGAENLDGREGR